MAENLEYNNLIEDYLKGNLSEQDKAAFEKQLNVDSSLRSEFEIQKDIVSAIRNARKAEIKFSLASVHVPWYYMISTGWKIAATVSLITVAGAGTFYAYHHHAKPENKQTVITTEPGNSGNKVPESIVPVEPEKNKSAAPDTVNVKNRENDAGRLRNKTVTAIQPSENKKKENTEVVPPQVNVPQPEMDQSAGDNSENDLSVNVPDELNPSLPKTEDKVLSVNTVKTKDYHFNYSFSEGKLKLYGDFSGNPYKILEINSTTGKKYFLLYNENYYYLNQNTGEIKALEKVTDQGLIDELNILNNNK